MSATDQIHRLEINGDWFRGSRKLVGQETLVDIAFVQEVINRAACARKSKVITQSRGGG